MNQTTPLLAAVIHFLQSLSTESGSITIDQLSNGIGYEQMLRHMGFEIPLHHSNTFVQSFQNLKSIYEIVVGEAVKYNLSNILEESIDIVQISKSQNAEHICKLFLCCQAVALKGNNKEYFIQKMLELEQSEQFLLINNLKNLMEKKENEISSNDILLHKITELEHQNIELQKVIQQETATNQKLSVKVQDLNKRIISYQQLFENQQNLMLSLKYSKQFSQRKSLTPNRSVSDSIQQYETQIAALQFQLQTMKQTQSKFVDLRKKYEQLDYKYNELVSNSSELVDRQEELKTIKSYLLQKQSQILKLTTLIKQLSLSNQHLHKRNIEDSINIQLQMVKIQDLQKQLQSFKQQSTKGSQMEREALSEICPDINQQANYLRQQNQNLLSNIERTTKQMQLVEKELEKYKRQNYRLGALEKENKKLQQILMDYTSARGEENDVLVGCLYELRMKFTNQMLETIKKPKKQKQTRGRYDD